MNKKTLGVNEKTLRVNEKTWPTASDLKHVRARGLRNGVLLAAGAALAGLAAAHVHAAETPIKIALIADKTGRRLGLPLFRSAPSESSPPRP